MDEAAHRVLLCQIDVTEPKARPSGATLTPPAPSLPSPSPRPGERGTPGASLLCSLFSRLGGGRWEKRVGVMRGLGVGALQAPATASARAMETNPLRSVHPARSPCARAT